MEPQEKEAVACDSESGVSDYLSSNSAECMNSASDDDVSIPEEIMANLAGVLPKLSHKTSIVAFLNQMFRDETMDPTKLANFIIEKGIISSVLVDEVEDEEQSVFGITASIDLLKLKDDETVEELKTYIVGKVENHGTSDDLDYVKGLFYPEQASEKGALFWISEKIINLPSRATLFLLEQLTSEVKSEVGDADHVFIFILHTYKNGDNFGFSNEEQEVISNNARFVDYPVSIEIFGTILVNGEDNITSECEQYRRICFVAGTDKLDACISQMKAVIYPETMD